MKRADFYCQADQTSGISVTKQIDKQKQIDNKKVLFISNLHDPSMVTEETSKNKDGTELKIGESFVTKDYNKHLGYIDKADMLKSYYELDRKSKKWIIYEMNQCIEL